MKQIRIWAHTAKALPGTGKDEKRRLSKVYFDGGQRVAREGNFNSASRAFQILFSRKSWYYDKRVKFARSDAERAFRAGWNSIAKNSSITNREAWQKGYADGFAGRNSRPDYPLVGLAGSYRLGYEAGYKRRKEPKGPRKNKARSFNPTITGLKGELWQVDKDIADLETDPFYKETPGRRAYRSKWLAYHRRQRRQLEQLLKTLERAAKQRINGIVEAAAGLQALEYIGAKAKRGGLGRKPKYNPDDARFLIQVVKVSGGRERFITNNEKEARATAASWYSRGASVTIVDRKKKTQTVYGKKNPRANNRQKGSRDALGVWHAENPQGFRQKDYEQLVKEYGVKKTQRAFHYWIAQPFSFRSSVKALPFLRSNEYLWNDSKYDKRVDNPGKMFYVYAQVKPNVSGNHDPFLITSGIFRSKTSALAEAKRTYKESYNSKYLLDLEWKVLEYRIRKNPSVTDLSRTFQGEADGSLDHLYAADGAPANLARAGKLVFLKVKGKTFRIPGAVVAIAPNEKLWITGKPPLFETKARKDEGLDVGEVTHICYETAKAHIGDGKTFEYVHEFGEDGGKRPHLIIDHEGMPVLRGGDYKIRAEGIVN